MRHSKPELTANIYSDPKLLDIVSPSRLPFSSGSAESSSQYFAIEFR